MSSRIWEHETRDGDAPGEHRFGSHQQLKPWRQTETPKQVEPEGSKPGRAPEGTAFKGRTEAGPQSRIRDIGTSSLVQNDGSC